VRNHFEYLADAKRREFRALMARGRVSLAIGLTFLAGCMLVSNALPADGGALGSVGLPVAQRPLLADTHRSHMPRARAFWDQRGRTPSVPGAVLVAGADP
jgi:hypothetical protein